MMKGHAGIRLGIALTLGCSLGLYGGCPGLPGPEGGGGGEDQGELEQLVQGGLIFAANCSGCHGADACGRTGPSIRGVSQDLLSTLIRSADSNHLGGTWPDMSGADFAALAAYLASLSPAECPPKQLIQASVPLKHIDLSTLGEHDPNSSKYDAKKCTACHGNRTNEGALDGTTPAAHSVMPYLLGSGAARCSNCHASVVDLAFHSDSRLRANRYSASASCASAKCHGVSGPRPFYMVDK